ncbi:MAG TPA: hypothetical protein VGH72_32575, partial [Pseudonocardia sp.]
VPARVSPLSGQPDPRDLAFIVNSTYFWFDHEFDQNFVELTIAGRSPDSPPLNAAGAHTDGRLVFRVRGPVSGLVGSDGLDRE